MISIIIPAYNVEKYLRECLDSALSQTYINTEIILVDDGSTDSTPDIAREYASRDRRVRVFTQPHSGVSAARNAALRHVRGEWITFLDSDDCIFPHALELLVTLGEQTGARVIYGGWTDNRDTKGPLTPLEAKFECLRPEEVISRVLYQQELLPTPWGKLYYHHCLEDIRFKEGLIYEDLDLFYKICAREKFIVATNSIVYFYRHNPDSLTNSFSPARFDVLRVTERIEAFIADHYPALLPAARDRRLSANFNMLGLIALYDREGKHSSVADSCWALIRKYRRESLFNPKVRLKNKIGILASYLGRGFLGSTLKLFYGRGAR